MGTSVDERNPLRVSREEVGNHSPGGAMKKFLMMSIWFSINHGAVGSGLALASTVLGTDLGGMGSGVLYLCYTATALILATPVVQTLGEKRALVAGLGLYSFYLASFLIALACDDRSDVDEESPPMCARLAFVSGSAIGGFGAGFYWTAQSCYFSRCALEYAAERNISKSSATSYFGGIFSALYLSFEMIAKLTSFVCLETMSESTGQFVVFVILTSMTLISTVGMAFAPPLPRDSDSNQSTDEPDSPAKTDQKSRVLATFYLMKNPTVWLWLPFNFSFGLFSALVTNVVNARIINEYLGSWAVPLLSAGISGVAASSAFPLGWLGRKFGSQLPAMMCGIAMFVIEGVVYLIWSEEALGKWSFMIPLCIVQGISRAVNEGPNKAMIADTFQEPIPRQAAFSNWVLQNGFSSSLGFFVFPPVLDCCGRIPLAIMCLVPSVLATIATPIVFSRNSKKSGYEDVP